MTWRTELLAHGRMDRLFAISFAKMTHPMPRSTSRLVENKLWPRKVATPGVRDEEATEGKHVFQLDVYLSVPLSGECWGLLARRPVNLCGKLRAR